MRFPDTDALTVREYFKRVNGSLVNAGQYKKASQTVYYYLCDIMYYHDPYKIDYENLGGGGGFI